MVQPSKKNPFVDTFLQCIYSVGLICNVPADIGILLDGSDSIDDRGFIKEKNFAANLIDNLDIGPDTIHASVIVYSTLIGQTIPFTPFKPKTLLTILTRNLKQPKVGTNTAKGINKMREYFRIQGRRNAPKVMVIVTDGRSTRPSETIAEAELAKREGIVVIAVGVGTQIFRDELRQIATNERKLFEVSDFAALQRIIIAIRDLICQGKICYNNYHLNNYPGFITSIYIQNASQQTTVLSVSSHGR